MKVSLISVTNTGALFPWDLTRRPGCKTDETRLAVRWRLLTEELNKGDKVTVRGRSRGEEEQTALPT